MSSTPGDRPAARASDPTARARIRRLGRGALRRLRRVAGRAAAAAHAAAAPPASSRPRPTDPVSRFALTLSTHTFADGPRPAQVVVLADSSSPVPAWLALFPAGSVTVLAADEPVGWGLAQRRATFRAVGDADERDDALSRLTRVDVIVDLLPGDAARHDEVFRSTFLHLRDHGLFALDGAATGVNPFTRAAAGLVDQLLGDDDPEDPAMDRHPHELSKAVAALTLGRDLVVAEKRMRHYYKVPESRAAEVLADRDPTLSVTELEVRPGGAFEMAGTLVSHASSAPIPMLPTRFEYPPLHLRHYEGRVALVANSLVHTQRSILPDSFRYHLVDSPGNPRIVNSSPRHGRIRQRLRPTRTLPGTYYLLDSENSGHFGHLTTEVVSKLWGWQRAKDEIPDLKAIFRIRYEGERDPVLEKRFFGAYGIAEEDLVWIHEPVWLDSLVAATPMWHNQPPHYVHPGITEVWRRLSLGLRAPDGPAYDKVFVSRRPGRKNRDCHNSPDVDAIFAANGFTVLYPEDHDLALQAAIFARARVVAGFGGSGMFNVLHADHLEAMIVLSSEAYTARNELLYAAALGCDIHYFWSKPDIPMPDDTWTKEAYYSGWAFDMERNRDDLVDLLGSL